MLQFCGCWKRIFCIPAGKGLDDRIFTICLRRTLNYNLSGITPIGCSTLSACRIVESEPGCALFRNIDTQEMVFVRGIAAPIGVEEGRIIVIQNPVGLLHRTIVGTGRVAQERSIAIKMSCLGDVRCLELQFGLGHLRAECNSSAAFHQSLGFVDQVQQLLFLSSHISVVCLLLGCKKRLVLYQKHSIGIGKLLLCGICTFQHLQCLLQCLVGRGQQGIVYRCIFVLDCSCRVDKCKLADTVMVHAVGVGLTAIGAVRLCHCKAQITVSLCTVAKNRRSPFCSIRFGGQGMSVLGESLQGCKVIAVLAGTHHYL